MKPEGLPTFIHGPEPMPAQAGLGELGWDLVGETQREGQNDRQTEPEREREREPMKLREERSNKRN